MPAESIMQVVIARWTLVATLLVGACGDPAARVTLVPVRANDTCGHPTTRAAITLTAFAPSGEAHFAVPLDDRIDLADLPVDTVQIGVEVVAGGEVVAAGKTAPLDFANLPDGAAIPIVMGTADGFCPTQPMMYPREKAQVAPAGDGALVIDGDGGAHAEYYDRAAAAFTEVAVPAAFADGLVGAVLTPLPDGKVAMTGAVRGLLAVFDPADRTFGAAIALSQLRAFHGAAALDATHVIVSGGCAGICPATPLRSTIIYDLEGNPQGGPNLPIGALSEGGQLLDTGGDFVLAGGFGAPGEAYRFRLDDNEGEKLAGTAGQPALLDGGAVLTAFAPDGSATPAKTAVIVAPGGGPIALRDGPALAGARTIALEDGSVLVVGGAPEIARYDPTRDGWDVHAPRVDSGAPAPPPWTAPALARLSDGAVLVVGGGAAPSQDAWLYRPSLIGATSGLVIAAPLDPGAAGVLTAPDPATLVRSAGTWQLVAPPGGGLAARALVGGPRMQRGLLDATVTVVGGLALIAQQVTRARALVAELAPGEKARLVRLADGMIVCTGDVVTLPAGGTTVTLAVDDRVSVTVAGATVLDCDYAATDVGQWGLAAFGDGSRLSVTAITLTR
jgi:hypothetical protein